VTTRPTSSAGTGGRHPTDFVGGHRRPLILVVCCLAQFLGVLDTTVVNVALAAIRADLGFSTTGLQWVVSAYTLSCAGFLLLGGRAADLLGRREVFCAGLALFGLASLAGGLAQDPVMLIAARAAQGLGGAVMAPTSLSILANVYDEGAARNRAFGLWGTLGALGGASGALVGGLVMEALSWRWILLVNAPVALAAAFVARRVIPPLGRRERRSFDLAGAITVTAGLVLVTYGVVASHRHGWTSVGTVAPLLVGLDLLALFALIEFYVVRAPLVPPRMLRSRALVGANVAAMCLGGCAISMWFFLSLYVQQVLGYSPLRAGLTFLPMSLTILACTQAAGRLAAHVGSGRVLAVGLTLLGSGLLLFARPGDVDVLAPSLLCAAGIGCSFVSATITATTGVRREDAGVASGLVNTSFQVGGSVGLALLATIAAGGGFQVAFAAAGVIALCGAGVALAVVVPRRQRGRCQGQSRFGLPQRRQRAPWAPRM
jgi:EmrB/QacA subfamily drug resistance transporter